MFMIIKLIHLNIHVVKLSPYLKIHVQNLKLSGVCIWFI